MKQITRYILAFAAIILFPTGAMANNTATVIKQINGAAAGATNPGEVVYNNGTITVTPSAGYYLTVADLTVVKTIDGQNAEARRRTPGIDNTVVVTASDPAADPSGVTTYTFTVTDTKYDYEITANFHNRTSIADATVTILGGPYTYDGTAHKPDVTVVLGGVTLTKGTDYDVYYTDSINAGTGKITIVGTRTYNGMITGLQYTINKAKASVEYKEYSFTAKIGEPFDPPYVTVNPQGLTLVYWSSDNNVATVDPQTGEVTLVAPGEVNIYAEFLGDENYKGDCDFYYLTVLQRDIDPIDEDVVITMEDDDFFYTNDEGEKEEIKLDNTVIYDILFTLDITGDPSESDGYDETEHCIVLNHPMTRSEIDHILSREYVPGTDMYVDEYTGLTFKVPAGRGYVIIDSSTDGEYQMMVKIGDLEPIAFNHVERAKDSVLYECTVPTWVYVYNGGKVGNARVLSNHRAKKDKGHVKIFSITRSSSSGTGIEYINSEAVEETERWYDLQGNRINRPTKKGVYIMGDQKVIVR